VYPLLSDNSTCSEAGQSGTCVDGSCKLLPLNGASRRRLSDKQSESEWHQARRVSQLAHLSNEKLELSPYERMHLKKLNSKKSDQVTKYAQSVTENRRINRELQESMGLSPAPEYTTCPLPGQDPSEKCPAAHIVGCMDNTAINFNSKATSNGDCCYAPDRYVRVDMTESIFRENFWTMSVDGQMLGLGMPVVGQNEICVPADACVKVTVYDESCDGFGVGGGGLTVNSAFHDGTQLHKISDTSGDFECSKNIHFGDCPVEGCTDSSAINFNAEAGVDDGTCEYANCKADEKAVVVKIKLDEKPEETDWKITDANGYTLVDSSEFQHFYHGPQTTHFYCFPEDKCLYYLIKDAGGDGLSANGHYEVLYGRPGQFDVAAAGSEFEWIRAHFIGGAGDCKR